MQRSMELQQECNRLSRQKEEYNSTQLIRKTTENTKPGPESSMYLSPSGNHVAQNLRRKVPVQSILKRTPVYSSNARKSFISSPDDFKNSQNTAVSEKNNNEVPSSSSPIIQPPIVLDLTETPRKTCQNNATPEKPKLNIVKKRKLFRSNDDQEFD